MLLRTSQAGGIETASVGRETRRGMARPGDAAIARKGFPSAEYRKAAVMCCLACSVRSSSVAAVGSLNVSAAVLLALKMSASTSISWRIASRACIWSSINSQELPSRAAQAHQHTGELNLLRHRKIAIVSRHSHGCLLTISARLSSFELIFRRLCSAASGSI